MREGEGEGEGDGGWVRVDVCVKRKGKVRGTEGEREWKTVRERGVRRGGAHEGEGGREGARGTGEDTER